MNGAALALFSAASASSSRVPCRSLFRGSLAEASGGLAAADAASELLKALFQAILNDLRCLAGRLPCGCRALLRSLDGNFKEGHSHIRPHGSLFVTTHGRFAY